MLALTSVLIDRYVSAKLRWNITVVLLFCLHYFLAGIVLVSARFASSLLVAALFLLSEKFCGILAGWVARCIVPFSICQVGETRASHHRGLET